MASVVSPDVSEPLILATDLDGTFLGGSPEQRQRLYHWLEVRRDRLILIFVTGRDLPFIRSLCADEGVPWPDYVIGDVGTTIAGGPRLEPMAELEGWIAERWGDAGERVRELLADEPGLTLQPTPFRHRVSYYYQPDLLSPTTVEKIQRAGFDCLTSADTYLDVLPRGISKGPTLKFLVGHLDLDPARVLVAGDTLNDLSLFQTGYPGVAVGNSEPRLRKALTGLDHVYQSPQPGSAGILDAIQYFFGQ